MKKVVVCLFVLVSAIPINAYARRGCCSHHGGVAGCSSSGRQICNDGTLSPSCTCGGGSSVPVQNVKPTYIYGCTDSSAINYNPNANMDNGSCIAKKEGCMDTNAVNYDSTANTEDNSCHYEKIVVGKEKIKYKTKYKKNSKLDTDYKKVLQKGQDGEKEVTYKVTEDKDGNLITREEVAEKVITEPITKIVEVGTKESSGIVEFMWIISLIICFIYSIKNKNANLILNKIRPQKFVLKLVLYFLYIILIIPAFIDLVIVIIDIIKKIINKK